MQPSKLAKQAPYLLLLAIIAFYFYGLGQFPLVGPDEPRYAQVAREMWEKRNLIVPTLGGQQWFEKPVLLYWLMMLSYRLFRVSEAAARVGSASAGVVTVLGVYWIARKVEVISGERLLQGLGIWSAIVAATTMGIIGFSRAASFDILVTATMTWALAFFFAYELEPTGRRRIIYLIAFYVFVGLSLLAKGLVGFLVFGVVAVYFLVRREVPGRRLLLSLVWGLPLTLAVAAVWYGPVIQQYGRVFIDQFFLQHHFARYLSNKYNHPQRVYFYLVILVPLTLPWTPFFLNAVTASRSWHWRSGDSLSRMRVFSMAGLLLPVLFFSFSGSKLPGYIVPVLPFAALLVGERVTRFCSGVDNGKNSMRAVGALCLLFAAGALFYSWRVQMMSVRCAVAIALPLTVAGILVFGLLHFRTLCVLIVAGVTIVSSVTVLNCGVEKFAERESVKHLIQAADARGYSNLHVCGLHVVERSAEFYASGRLIYGSDGQPLKLEGPGEVLETAKQQQGAVLVLVPLEYLYQLTSLKSATSEVIADNGMLAIVLVRLR